VQAHLRDVELEGTLRNQPGAAYRLVVDGKLVDAPPIKDVAFAQTDHPLRVALIVQANSDYRADIHTIKSGLIAFIGQLPERSRLTVVSYTWEVKRRIGLGDATAATQAVRGIAVGPREADEVALVEAVQTGVRGLAEGPPYRRLLVVVSDGLNRDPKRDTFRALGDMAREARTPIFPVAYSPIDERGPLLNLGEIAKRSLGTLRWARTAADIEAQLRTLGVEVTATRVLTFDVPTRCASAHTMQVTIQHQRLISNSVKTPRSTETVASLWKRPVVRWIALGLAVVVLLVLVWGGARLLAPRRRG
jgi:hypothetical protein